MAGSRKFQLLCSVAAFVAVLSLSSGSDATDPDYQKVAQDEYMAWVGRMAEQQEASTEVGAEVESLSASQIIITVNKQGGKGDFTGVQKAIDSIPDNSRTRFIVAVASGTYEEKVTIPSSKGPITLLGAGMTRTKITFFLDSAQAVGTENSASVSVFSAKFICKDIAFENSSPAPPPGAVGRQAVAFVIEADKAAFYRVAFLGYQDTLYDKLGRHYFKDCYMRGSIDFIFGDGTSYYETCYLDSDTTTFGSLTAQQRETTKETSGYSFVDCTVNGTGYSYLGRAWGSASRVVFIRTYFSAAIRPEGWYDWGVPSRDNTVFYGEYECYGPGSNRNGRVTWSKELTAAEVEPFLTVAWIKGSSWLPSGPQ